MSTMRAMTVFIRPTKWEGLVCMRMELYGIRKEIPFFNKSAYFLNEHFLGHLISRIIVDTVVIPPLVKNTYIH